MRKHVREQISDLPSQSGVYFFKNTRQEILYIGKAKNLKKRIQSHFRGSETSAPKESGHWAHFYSQVDDIDYVTTPTERDALILEAELVKKYQPKYNVELKDDKGFLYVAFFDEEYPRVFLTHQPKKEKGVVIGPFVEGKALRKYLSTLRKIFPYRTCKNKPDRPCLYAHMGLCAAHGKTVSHYPLILEGLKAMLRLYSGKKIRMEAYDISNTQGSLSVGSMVVFSGARPNKSQYRKFKIKTVQGSNDPASLKEIIGRRLTHDEWRSPDIIIIDGGKSQLSQVRNLPRPTLTLAKIGAKNGRLYSPYGTTYVLLSKLPNAVHQTLIALRDEAHRFAVTYHRNRRIKTLLS